ncbi:phosphate regulon sensor protein PhoR [Methylophilaceae bacterium]|nr:phosphate regulon sensor protein PhoR [Methylophilaceae bacterium]
MNKIFIKIITRLFIFALCSFFVGLFFSIIYGLLLFIFLLILYVYNQTYYLISLDNWLNRPSQQTVPIGNNLWEPTFSKLYQFHKNIIKTKRDLGLALDQFILGAQALPDGVLSLDQSNHILWANKKIQRMLGIKLPDDLNKPINYIFRDTKLLDLIDANDNKKSISIIIDDDKYQINLIEFGAENKLLICRNINNEEKSEVIRKRFISDVSHELKTPLTVIMGNSELMLNTDIEPKQQKILLKATLDQAQRMNNLIADLISLNRVDTTKNILRDKKVMVADLKNQILSSLSSLRLKKDISFEFNIDSKKNILGSFSEVYSALENLVSNAFRYTDKGSISINWSIKKGQGIISVTDSGIGISKAHLNKITDRFYRVDTDRSRNSGGTGLGLAIVKNIMDHHNGSIEIKSDTSKGSTFSLVFPKERVL